MNKKLEKLVNDTCYNLYQVEHPNFGDTDCGSERIVNAIVNITMDAFNLAVEETGIKDAGLRYFCGDDLLERAMKEIQKQMEYNVVEVCYSVDGKLKGRIINRQSKRCGMEGCCSDCFSVRWEDGRLTYPCSSMIKQVSENEWQICHSPSQMAYKGFNPPELLKD